MYEFITGIMYKASELMLSAEEIGAKVKVKPGDANYVTAYDVAVENCLIAELKKRIPEAAVIGEEEEQNPTELLPRGVTLIIDPIDGTTNFIHNCRHSAISVGVCDRGEMVFGAVYDPYLDVMYSAERGQGAFQSVKKAEKTRLRVTDKPLSDCLSAFGTSPYYRDELSEKTFETARKMFLHTHDIRRTGSAALDLSSVAAGVFDIFFEYRLSPWDYAAGSLIIEEAGGVITDMNGNKLGFSSPSSVLCGNKKAHAQWLELENNV